jgi:hypothetical protein
MTEPIDLTTLRLDDARRAALLSSIMAAAEPELRRRQAADVSPMLVLSHWLRPALAAAAVLAVVCVSVLALEWTPAIPGAGLADALAVPRPADEWLVGERAPTVADVFLAMEMEDR